MISVLQGKVISKSATSLVIDCAGIGFLVNVPFPFAQSVQVNSTITIHIQTVFGRNSMELYGFGSEKDKDIFNIITSVRGIGARAGISILSRLTPDEVTKAINENNVNLFTTIPGIGKKKAETIVFNLRKSAEESSAVPDSQKEIIQALRSLGFAQKEAMQKLSEVPDWTKKSVAEVIRAVLKKGK
jgi:Holliday junction DNA helicase RuvA